MLDLRWIRDNAEALDQALITRGALPLSQELLALDAENRDLKTALQHIREAKNALAQKTAEAAAEDRPALVAEGAQLKTQEAQLVKAAALCEERLQEKLAYLPNIPAEDVPIGKDDSDNQELRRFGTPRSLPTVKDHMTLGEALGGIDAASAVAMSGSRFVLLKGAIAHLERALAHWMLDTHSAAGYTEVSPPYMVSATTAFGSGNLPHLAEDLFHTTDGRVLIPTAEMALCSLFAGKTIEGLPLRFTALSPCFRKEAGSAGRDTHGMMRLHQFRKVELFCICTPEQAEAEHQRIVAQAEGLLQALELPYRTVVLCTGDMGFSARKTYDIEVYVPSEQRYREISSCSNCGDFQARRVQTRYRDKEGKLAYVHMLNGSGLPTGRTLLALLETYQNADGSVTVPSVLRPYMQGMETIQ